MRLTFDATKIQPSVPFEALPDGEYPVIITDTNEKPTKNGLGSYLEVIMKVIDGEYANRRITDRLNIKNQNETTVEIAHRQLSAICYVTGELLLQDTQQLHGKPFRVIVAKVPRNDKPDQMTNEIRGYRNSDGTEPGFSGKPANPAAEPQGAGWNAPKPSVPPIPAQAPGASATPPWAQQQAGK